MPYNHLIHCRPLLLLPSIFQAPRSFRVSWLLASCMATHSSTLAWKLPWTEEPGRLQSMGSQRVRHDRATSLSLFTFMHWRRKWQPTPVFLPGESRGWGAWWAAVYGVTQSRTWLKRLSSSSSSSQSIEASASASVLPVNVSFSIWIRFILLFFFEIIVDAHAIIRNDTDRSFRPFSQYPPVVGKCIVFLQSNIIIRKLTLIQPLNA